MSISSMDNLYRVAMMYYVQGRTMDTIGREIGASRSTVSRMLQQSRAYGLVHISVRPPQSGSSGLTAEIAKAYEVRATVVPVRSANSAESRVNQVTMAAARVLQEAVTSGSVLGVAWGDTVSAVARHLNRQDVQDVNVVQLNGAANVRGSGLSYAGDVMTAFSIAFDAATHYLPVPAFFDYEKSKRMMWREGSIRHALSMRARTSIALFGVGTMEGDPASHVYTAGYLQPQDLRELRGMGVAGDVCTNFLRPDGTHRDIEMNRRASGPSPDDLAKIPMRLCVAEGNHRVAALRGALNAGTVTDLVIDEPSARTLMSRG